MDVNIPYMFDCWADPVVHLLLLSKELHGLGPRTRTEQIRAVFQLIHASV